MTNRKEFTVGSARLARGYTGLDHLLNDRPLEAMCGVTYPSVQAAARAAGKLLRGTQERLVWETIPVVLLDEDGDGSKWWPDGTRVSS